MNKKKTEAKEQKKKICCIYQKEALSRFVYVCVCVRHRWGQPSQVDILTGTSDSFHSV